jgi:hypothetical protein
MTSRDDGGIGEFGVEELRARSLASPEKTRGFGMTSFVDSE